MGLARAHRPMPNATHSDTTKWHGANRCCSAMKLTQAILTRHHYHILVAAKDGGCVHRGDGLVEEAMEVATSPASACVLGSHLRHPGYRHLRPCCHHRPQKGRRVARRARRSAHVCGCAHDTIATHNLSHNSMRDGTATSPTPNAKRFTQWHDQMARGKSQLQAVS